MSVESTYLEMKRKLSNIAPDAELRIKAELVYEIKRLKIEKNAVILGHNYMEPVLYHTIPDYVGDSLYLSRMAAKTEKDIIIFCGVRFMAETAKILNPNKTVLLPAERAGCSLAESITAADVRWLRQLYPGVPVIAYVNTYADVKAEVDVCCTSGNARAVVESFNNETVIFLPDEYLAGNIARETGKRIIFPTLHAPPSGETLLDYVSIEHPAPVPTGAMIGWRGHCEVHEKFNVQDIHNIRQQFPKVIILAHPECSPEVTAASDMTGSTSDMIKFIEKSSAPQFLLLTECSMADNIAAANPDKEMLRLCSVRCPHMNEITLEDTLKSLQLNRYVIEVPEDIRLKAARSVERMITIG